MITQINNNLTHLNPNTLVNSETGETVLSEMGPDSTLVVKGPSDHFTISSEEFIVIDSKAFTYVCGVLGRPDLEKVTRMSNMLKTDFNILHSNNNNPHNLTSLAKALEVSQSELKKIISRLVDKNVLAYVVCKPSKFLQKIYMLNPTLARKRKTFHEDLRMFFKDLSTEGGQKEVDSTPKRKRGRQPAI
jgi:predicted transcriptional regulator